MTVMPTQRLSRRAGHCPAWYATYGRAVYRYLRFHVDSADTADDLTMVRRLYGDLGLGADPGRPYAELLTHVRRHPEIAAMNAHVEQRDR